VLGVVEPPRRFSNQDTKLPQVAVGVGVPQTVALLFPSDNLVGDWMSLLKPPSVAPPRGYYILGELGVGRTLTDVERFLNDKVDEDAKVLVATLIECKRFSPPKPLGEVTRARRLIRVGSQFLGDDCLKEAWEMYEGMRPQHVPILFWAFGAPSPAPIRTPSSLKRAFTLTLRRYIDEVRPKLVHAAFADNLEQLKVCVLELLKMRGYEIRLPVEVLDVCLNDLALRLRRAILRGVEYLGFAPHRAAELLGAALTTLLIELNSVGGESK
jgi:hypothetical protein